MCLLCVEKSDFPSVHLGIIISADCFMQSAYFENLKNGSEIEVKHSIFENMLEMIGAVRMV